MEKFRQQFYSLEKIKEPVKSSEYGSVFDSRKLGMKFAANE